MKTIVLEYFDIYNKKHCIKLPYEQKGKIFKEGLKIDASDVLGLLFVCDGDFTLYPVKHSVREYADKEVYLCRVYDENNQLLDSIKEILLKKASEEWNRLGEFFIGQEQLYKKLRVQPINVM